MVGFESLPFKNNKTPYMNMAFAHPGGLGLGCPPTCEMFCIEASEPSFDCNELLSPFMFSWNFI